tara:strand:+ start:238 stop:468 length:231 start_codon:yes stop_codon:yes gene_type:complete
MQTFLVAQLVVDVEVVEVIIMVNQKLAVKVVLVVLELWSSDIKLTPSMLQESKQLVDQFNNMMVKPFMYFNTQEHL